MRRMEWQTETLERFGREMTVGGWVVSEVDPLPVTVPAASDGEAVLAVAMVRLAVAADALEAVKGKGAAARGRYVAARDARNDAAQAVKDADQAVKRERWAGMTARERGAVIADGAAPVSFLGLPLPVADMMRRTAGSDLGKRARPILAVGKFRNGTARRVIAVDGAGSAVRVPADAARRLAGTDRIGWGGGNGAGRSAVLAASVATMTRTADDGAWIPTADDYADVTEQALRYVRRLESQTGGQRRRATSGEGGQPFARQGEGKTIRRAAVEARLLADEAPSDMALARAASVAEAAVRLDMATVRTANGVADDVASDACLLLAGNAERATRLDVVAHDMADRMPSVWRYVTAQESALDDVLADEDESDDDGAEWRTVTRRTLARWAVTNAARRYYRPGTEQATDDAETWRTAESADGAARLARLGGHDVNVVTGGTHKGTPSAHVGTANLRTASDGGARAAVVRSALESAPREVRAYLMHAMAADGARSGRSGAMTDAAQACYGGARGSARIRTRFAAAVEAQASDVLAHVDAVSDAVAVVTAE